jgi:ribonuclease VapC
MFIDASAIVAILTLEPEADALIEVLEAASSPITSAVAIFEATLGICRKQHAGVAEAKEDVQAFLDAAEIQIVAIGAEDAEMALDAFSRFGKGRGHPAQLNLGDCFAYAIAKNNKASLPFKGGNFDNTNIKCFKA